MPIRKRIVVPTIGTGELRYSGFNGSVDYELAGDTAALTAKSKEMKGSLTASQEVAEGAFRAGEGFLKLEDGRDCRIRMVAYTAGGDTAYFEIRV
jgi:hypothetical protein